MIRWDKSVGAVSGAGGGWSSAAGIPNGSGGGVGIDTFGPMGFWVGSADGCVKLGVSIGLVL